MRQAIGLRLGLKTKRRATEELNFSGLPNLPTSRQSSTGWVDQETVDAFASASLWIDAFSTYTDVGGTTPAVAGDPIAAALDNVTGDLFTQSNAANRPTLAAGPSITGDRTKSLTGNPGTTGTQKLIIATISGIAEAEVDFLPTYLLQNTPGLVHFVAGDFTPAEIERIEAFAIAEGAIEDWSVSSWENYFRESRILSWSTPIPSSVTNLSATWIGNPIASWDTPIPNSVTNLTSTWRSTQLTSWNILIPSSVSIIRNTWRSNSALADFAANIFDGCPCTNFTGAFTDTNLTQTSIDNILVSINSNSTSNGTFDQSGGSAPSAVGEAAIDALRGRGWTVTVTGGY